MANPIAATDGAKGCLDVQGSYLGAPAWLDRRSQGDIGYVKR